MAKKASWFKFIPARSAPSAQPLAQPLGHLSVGLLFMAEKGLVV